MDIEFTYLDVSLERFSLESIFQVKRLTPENFKMEDYINPVLAFQNVNHLEVHSHLEYLPLNALGVYRLLFYLHTYLGLHASSTFFIPKSLKPSQLSDAIEKVYELELVICGLALKYWLRSLSHDAHAYELSIRKTIADFKSRLVLSELSKNSELTQLTGYYISVLSVELEILSYSTSLSVQLLDYLHAQFGDMFVQAIKVVSRSIIKYIPFDTLPLPVTFLAPDELQGHLCRYSKKFPFNQIFSSIQAGLDPDQDSLDPANSYMFITSLQHYLPSAQRYFFNSIVSSPESLDVVKSGFLLLYIGNQFINYQNTFKAIIQKQLSAFHPIPQRSVNRRKNNSIKIKLETYICEKLTNSAPLFGPCKTVDEIVDILHDLSKADGKSWEWDSLRRKYFIAKKMMKPAKK